MRGLLRNNFYSASNNLQLAFIINVIFMAAPIVLGKGDYLMSMMMVQPCMLILNLGTALHSDTASKWNRFELTMPIRRGDVIKARYISFLMIILAGLLMSGVTVLLTYAVGIPVDVQGIWFGFAFGLLVASTSAACAYPIMLKFGTEKNEMIMMLSALVAVGVLMLITNIMMFLVKGIAYNDIAILPLLKGVTGDDADFILGITTVAVAIVLFALSYFLSQSMYRKKEL